VADPGGLYVAGRAELVRSWQRIYGLFRQWQRDGTWAAVISRLQAAADASGLIAWDVSVDSTTARAGTVRSSLRSWTSCGCPASVPVGHGRVRDRVLADKAYTSAADRAYLRRRGIRATIPIKTDQAIGQ